MVEFGEHATEQLRANAAALVLRPHFQPREKSGEHTVADGGDEPPTSPLVESRATTAR